MIKLIMPAWYFHDLKILKWLLDNHHDVNDKNDEK